MPFFSTSTEYSNSAEDIPYSLLDSTAKELLTLLSLNEHGIRKEDWASRISSPQFLFSLLRHRMPSSTPPSFIFIEELFKNATPAQLAGLGDFILTSPFASFVIRDFIDLFSQQLAHLNPSQLQILLGTLLPPSIFSLSLPLPVSGPLVKKSSKTALADCLHPQPFATALWLHYAIHQIDASRMRIGLPSLQESRDPLYQSFLPQLLSPDYRHEDGSPLPAPQERWSKFTGKVKSHLQQNNTTKSSSSSGSLLEQEDLLISALPGVRKNKKTLADPAHWALIECLNMCLHPQIQRTNFMKKILAGVEGLSVNGPAGSRQLATRPLHVACRYNDTLTAQLLLSPQYAANPSLRDEYGASSLDYAIAFGNSELINFIHQSLILSLPPSEISHFYQATLERTDLSYGSDLRNYFSALIAPSTETPIRYPALQSFERSLTNSHALSSDTTGSHEVVESFGASYALLQPALLLQSQRRNPAEYCRLLLEALSQPSAHLEWHGQNLTHAAQDVRNIILFFDAFKHSTLASFLAGTESESVALNPAHVEPKLFYALNLLKDQLLWTLRQACPVEFAKSPFWTQALKDITYFTDVATKIASASADSSSRDFRARLKQSFSVEGVSTIAIARYMLAIINPNPSAPLSFTKLQCEQIYRAFLTTSLINGVSNPAAFQNPDFSRALALAKNEYTLATFFALPIERTKKITVSLMHGLYKKSAPIILDDIPVSVEPSKKPLKTAGDLDSSLDSRVTQLPQDLTALQDAPCTLKSPADLECEDDDWYDFSIESNLDDTKDTDWDLGIITQEEDSQKSTTPCNDPTSTAQDGTSVNLEEDVEIITPASDEALGQSQLSPNPIETASTSWGTSWNPGEWMKIWWPPRAYLIQQASSVSTPQPLSAGSPSDSCAKDSGDVAAIVESDLGITIGAVSPVLFTTAMLDTNTQEQSLALEDAPSRTASGSPKKESLSL